MALVWEAFQDEERRVRGHGVGSAPAAAAQAQAPPPSRPIGGGGGGGVHSRGLQRHGVRFPPPLGQWVEPPAAQLPAKMASLRSMVRIYSMLEQPHGSFRDGPPPGAQSPPGAPHAACSVDDAWAACFARAPRAASRDDDFDFGDGAFGPEVASTWRDALSRAGLDNLPPPEYQRAAEAAMVAAAGGAAGVLRLHAAEEAAAAGAILAKAQSWPPGCAPQPQPLDGRLSPVVDDGRGGGAPHSGDLDAPPLPPEEEYWAPPAPTHDLQPASTGYK
eukprot:107839-Chlamydomonas_euryale.AAC.1